MIPSSRSANPALAGPSSGPRHRDAADDEKVDGLDVAKFDAQSVLKESIRVLHVLEGDAVVLEHLGVQQDERGVLHELRHRSVELLPRAQGGEPERALSGVGFDFTTFASRNSGSPARMRAASSAPL